jgi:hypothetical protein
MCVSMHCVRPMCLSAMWVETAACDPSALQCVDTVMASICVCAAAGSVSHHAWAGRCVVCVANVGECV